MHQENSEQVLTSLRQIMSAIDQYSKYLAKNYGLTGPQLIVLRKISRLGECAIGDLAKSISLSQATVTSILDRLEKLRYVLRSRSDRDKRRVMVRLTVEGFEKLKSNPSLLQETFVEEFNRLQDWEQTLILSSIQRIAAMMKAKEIEAKPVLISGSLSATADEVIEFLHEDGNQGPPYVKRKS
jgi:DNA-binding MarR family transcriptional regulator